jgi:Protein of unknown function (DUF2946)
MDDTVLAALAKWPDVPAVYGWLGLTARGEWRLQGQPIANAALRDFIGRNYAGDERGRWYFQNGPQRVYVTLDATPWIWWIAQDEGGRSLHTHTGIRVRHLQGAWLDESGRAYLKSELGFGLLDSRDTHVFLEAAQAEGHAPLQPAELESWLTGAGLQVVVDGARLGLGGSAPLDRLHADQMSDRFAFVRSPQPD